MVGLFRRMARVKLKYFIPGLISLCFLLDYLGAFTHFFELDYKTSFEYPIEGDIRKWAEQVSVSLLCMMFIHLGMKSSESKA